MNKTYKIMTFGCQMNENDSEKLAGLLLNMGYQEAPEVASAGVVIINTCSVRENADVRVFGNLGNFKPMKKKNPEMVLAVCGCMMQQPEIVEKIQSKYPQVDLVFGTHNIHRFPELLANFQMQREPIVEVWEDNPEIVEGLPVARKYPFKSYVTIMNGCNNFCTYCIVPYTRGREVSRSPEHILAEIESLAGEGCVEVTLLGQNVNSYGKDLSEDYDFADLLRAVDQIPGIERVRFMTSHPKDLSEKVMDAMAQCEHVCPAIHLAIQSGSSDVLKRMNRRYTKEDVIDLVRRTKERVPGVAITTDIIVGFPGETEADFADTLEVVEACRFDSAFSFLYSIRTGTPAATMDDQVPDEIKHERLNRLLEVLHRIGGELNADFAGQVVKVLVEETSKNNAERLTGRTPEGKLVNFTGDLADIGSIVDVHITKAGAYSLTGEKVEEV